MVMLQRRGRMTYRALKVQFDLDDELLDTLKDELLLTCPVSDEAGRGLVWTSNPVAAVPEAQRGTDDAFAESR